jgi:hypothetical protein
MKKQLLTQTQILWSERIAEWETSGLSQSTFCQQHGLVYGTFIYWRSHLKKFNTKAVQPPISFLAVTCKPAKQSTLILKLNGQHSIELKSGFDPELLREVVQAVQQFA